MQQQVYEVYDVSLNDVSHGFERSVVNVWKYEILSILGKSSNKANNVVHTSLRL